MRTSGEAYRGVRGLSKSLVAEALDDSWNCSQIFIGSSAEADVA